MARVPFETVFKKSPERYILNSDIRLLGVTYPRGFDFPKEATVGSINWYLFDGRDIDIETDGSVLVIKGIYSL